MWIKIHMSETNVVFGSLLEQFLQKQRWIENLFPVKIDYARVLHYYLRNIF